MDTNATLEIVLDVGGYQIRIAKDSPYRIAENGTRGLESGEYRLDLEENAVTDGGYITWEHFEPRPIELTFGISDKKNTEAYRRLLLRYLNPKRPVTLTVTRTGVTRRIEGKIDGELEFSQPNIVQDTLYVTVSIICPDPWFRAAEGAEVLRFEKAVPLFTFPFNSLSGVGVMAGLVWRSDELTIVNDGDDAMGIVATISATGQIKNPKITLDGGEYVRLITVLETGDEAKISTVPKQKNVWLNGQSAVVYDRTSVFFQVPTGEHTLVLSADAGAENAATTVECQLKYLGV